MILDTKAELDAVLNEAEEEIAAVVKPIAARYGDRGIRFFGMLVGMAKEDIGTDFHTRSFGNLSTKAAHEVFGFVLERAGKALRVQEPVDE